MIDFKNNSFFFNSVRIPLVEVFKIWLSNNNIDWSQKAFQEMLKLTNTEL